MKKPKRIDDARDIYVKSKEPISLKALSQLPQWKGKLGFSEGQLSRRSREEKWVIQRKEYWEKVQAATDEKTVEKTAEKKAVLLEDLNEEHTERARMLLRLNEQKLKEAVKVNSEGEKFFDLKPKDLRTIQKNILELQAALRLYAGYDPDKPPKPGESAPTQTNPGADPFVEALGVTAKDDWADHD